MDISPEYLQNLIGWSTSRYITNPILDPQ